jgi:hypothetical protein
MSGPNLLGETAAVQKAQLADLKNNLQITSIRVDANWGYWEPQSGVFNWAPLDQSVALIRAEGLSIDFIIEGTPQWAASVPSDVTSSTDNVLPASAAQFASWAQAVASRYGSGGTTSYEIWNEENLNVLPAPSPSVYTADLKAAYASIKAVQPNETVVTGGLAPAADTASSINPVEFLSDIYADGAAGSFNAVAYHPYSYPVLPNTAESWSGWTNMSATTPSIRSVMVANGSASMKVWITEVGWPSNTATLTRENGLSAESDELTQVNTFANANSWVGPVYWFTYQDGPYGQFGLITSTGAHKPAYATMAGL